MEFEYNRNKILTNLIYGYFFLFFTMFLIIMIIRKLVIEWNEIQTAKLLFSIIAILLFSTLTYLFLGTAIVRNKYYQKNLKETIQLDSDKEIIIINDNLKKTKEEIHFDDVISVELFYSWNTNSFSSDLGFSKLNIKNRDTPLIITQSNINQFHLYEKFKNRITMNKSKFMNDIF